jgi:hypothetical protein
VHDSAQDLLAEIQRRIMRLVSKLKDVIVSPERKPRAIRAGPFRGIVMNLSLQSQTQIYLGLHEKETHGWLHRFSSDIATAIDIGVAYGELTIYFLTKTRVAKVFAFEPDLNCIPFLRENLGLNGVGKTDRVEVSTKFVGASDNEREIRLDSLAGSVRTPCFVKMDVEGAEEQILMGATNFNSLPGIRWLIETHSKELEAGCQDILTRAGFETKIIPNAWWRVFVPEMRACAHNRWLVAWKKDGFPQ